jgi:hypothetical protein
MMTEEPRPKQIEGENYSIGYCKPPVHARFQKGQSGNPKGRPKGTKNPATVIYNIMNQKMAIRIGSKTFKVSKFEAMIHTLSSKALKGDFRSISALLNMSIERGATINPPQDGMEITFVEAGGTEATMKSLAER